jgi:hypothetical protein
MSSVPLFTLMYFHRKRILTAITFCSVYGGLCYKGVKYPNDIIRMGIAGSLANVIIEAGFHGIDTINVRAKVSKKNRSSLHMASKIFRKEGLTGFAKGFSACFYGSIACGFIYFSLYKAFKQIFRDPIEKRGYNPAVTFFAASFVAEMFTLLVYYPYDMIKCRL